MRAGHDARYALLIGIALACAGCDGEDGDGDAALAGDAMTSQPPSEAAVDASEDASEGLDGSAGGVGGAGGTGGGDTGGEQHDAAITDGSEPDASPDEAVTMMTTHVYVGGYGAQIAHLVLDRSTGVLTHRGATNAGEAPSYLAVHPMRDALYAVNEHSSASGSEVLAFSIDAESGDLSMINAVPSGGEGAPHLAVHPTGRWIGVAHYGSGHVSILPVREDRGVGDVIDIDRGPSDLARKAHQIVFDPSGGGLLVPCLENNYVLQYSFALGALTPSSPPTVAVAGGPRHLALTPDQRYAFVLSELDSTITSFGYQGLSVQLSGPETIDSFEETAGASAHIAVHPSGRWLYASNRTENSLGVFSIDAGGRPHPVELHRTGIATPRDFAIDPSGDYLIVANQAGAQDLRVYRIDPSAGTLTFLSSTSVGGQPSCVAFATLPSG